MLSSQRSLATFDPSIRDYMTTATMLVIFICEISCVGVASAGRFAHMVLTYFGRFALCGVEWCASNAHAVRTEQTNHVHKKR